MRAASAIGAVCVTILVATAVWARPDPPRPVEFLNSGKVMPPGVPFSEAVRVDNLLYVSGAIGMVPGKLELVPGGLQAEGKQALQNLKTTVEANGYTMRDVVKCTVMLADISKWGEFNEVYKSFFTEPYPARSTVEAARLPRDARIEIDAIAMY